MGRWARGSGSSAPPHQTADGGPTAHGERYRMPTDCLSTASRNPGEGAQAGCRRERMPFRLERHARPAGATRCSDKAGRNGTADAGSHPFQATCTWMACGRRNLNAARDIRCLGLTHLHGEGALPSGTPMIRETDRKLATWAIQATIQVPIGVPGREDRAETDQRLPGPAQGFRASRQRVPPLPCETEANRQTHPCRVPGHSDVRCRRPRPEVPAPDNHRWRPRS